MGDSPTDRVFFIPEVHSLQDLSAITIARTFWDNPTVIDKIDKYFDDYDKATVYMMVGFDQDEPWREIIEFIMQKIKKIRLPDNILKKITTMTIHIGNKVFYWKKYVVKELPMPFHVKYIKEMCWTGFSTVDEVQIFRESWCKHNVFDSDFHEYAMASIFREVKFMIENEIEMGNLICSLYESEGFDLDKVVSSIKKFTLLEVTAMYVLAVNDISDLSKGFQLFEDVMKSNDPFSELFFMCLPHGLVHAANMCFASVKKEDRKNLLKKAAIEILKIDQSFPIYRYRKEKHVELFLFAINCLPKEKNKLKLLSENIIHVCDLFITVWPYHKLLLPIIDYVWGELTKYSQKELINYFLDFLIKYSRTWFHQNKEIAQQLLSNTLKKMKGKLKLNLFIKNERMEKLLEIQDFSTINLIFGDEHLKNHKNEIIENFDSIFKEAAEKKNMETLNSYFNNMNLTEIEHEQLKRKYQ